MRMECLSPKFHRFPVASLKVKPEQKRPRTSKKQSRFILKAWPLTTIPSHHLSRKSLSRSARECVAARVWPRRSQSVTKGWLRTRSSTRQSHHPPTTNIPASPHRRPRSQRNSERHIEKHHS